MTDTETRAQRHARLTAQRPQAEQPTPPVSQDPRERPSYRSRARVTHEQWRGGSRAEQAAARAAAEQWWQAIGDWETRSNYELVPRTSLGSGGAGRMVAVVGNYGRGQTVLGYTQVNTPIGWLSVSAVSRAITESGSPALERLRSGTGLGSLLDRGRWQRGGLVAGRHVLQLAVVLGDERAAGYLASLPRE